MVDRLLIVDDEEAFARTLAPVLKANGMVVEIAHSAGEALRKARLGPFDVVLLDLGLPDADGKDIIGTLQSLGCLAIIILSARGMEAEKVAALDSGADDYLGKPFGIEELLARIRVALRRHRKLTIKPPFVSRELALDFTSRQVMLRGQEIKLSPKEYALLECLCHHAGQIVTRRQLLIAGWNDPTTDPQNLRVYMTLLRQKIEQDKSNPRLIITEAGVGYRIMSDDP